VINAVWISISDPVEFLQNPVQSGSEVEMARAANGPDFGRAADVE